MHHEAYPSYYSRELMKSHFEGLLYIYHEAMAEEIKHDDRSRCRFRLATHTDSEDSLVGYALVLSDISKATLGIEEDEEPLFTEVYAKLFQVNRSDRTLMTEPLEFTLMRFNEYDFAFDESRPGDSEEYAVSLRLLAACSRQYDDGNPLQTDKDVMMTIYDEHIEALADMYPEVAPADQAENSQEDLVK